MPLGTNIDCADGNATRNPGATESCNNLDDDCDGTIDEGVSIVCYADGDGDTYPLATALPQNACTAAGRGDVGGC
ncbi:MAG: hypothetical protein GWN07_32985, partial [Actinobacteria bacterium]|nr:hypothetical protein [Actinomycetota bacterium]NIS35591.1 hypothetical protein [Actinomycetota bacterium]NIU70249.1 hypothetical protein [Actinomycetota bacterium]NIV58390.1 hypothetical protein [Actinomycetota bacterium]NIV89930.1 hypothetical protein [Actinomycetota bacterium]